MFYKELENTNLLNKEELVKLDNYLAFTKKCEKPTPLEVGWIAQKYINKCVCIF